jgi:hypothetical protein
MEKSLFQFIWKYLNGFLPVLFKIYNHLEFTSSLSDNTG